MPAYVPSWLTVTPHINIPAAPVGPHYYPARTEEQKQQAAAEQAARPAPQDDPMYGTRLGTQTPSPLPPPTVQLVFSVPGRVDGGHYYCPVGPCHVKYCSGREKDNRSRMKLHITTAHSTLYTIETIVGRDELRAAWRDQWQEAVPTATCTPDRADDIAEWLLDVKYELRKSNGVAFSFIRDCYQHGEVSHPVLGVIPANPYIMAWSDDEKSDEAAHVMARQPAGRHEYVIMPNPQLHPRLSQAVHNYFRYELYMDQTCERSMLRHLSDPTVGQNSLIVQFRDAVLRTAMYYFDVLRSGGRCSFVKQQGGQLVQCSYHIQNMERQGAIHVRICPDDCAKHTAAFPHRKVPAQATDDQDPWRLASIIDHHHRVDTQCTLMKLIPLMGCYELRCAMHMRLTTYPSIYSDTS